MAVDIYSEAGGIDLNAHCRGLALSVAALDDAGLTVEHKRAIHKARQLRQLMAERRKYAAAIRGGEHRGKAEVCDQGGDVAAAR